jgi:hypothetical protein
MAWTIFEYLYRDADNHKAFGKVAFVGEVSGADWDVAMSSFEEGSYFIAEQVGLPALYSGLFRWSGDVPTDADHCWHEFVSITNSYAETLDADIPQTGLAKDFVERIASIKNWDILLSPIAEHQRRNSLSG